MAFLGKFREERFALLRSHLRQELAKAVLGIFLFLLLRLRVLERLPPPEAGAASVGCEFLPTANATHR